MKRILIIALLPLVFVSGCLMKKMTQITEQGEQAFKNNNYVTALNHFEEVINTLEERGKRAEGEIYYKAGKAAYQLEKYDKAIGYLEEAEYLKYNHAQMYYVLAKASKKADNLSKEIDALESYVNNHKNGEHYQEMRIRLFETYIESKNWQPAMDLWPRLSKEEQQELREEYLVVNKELENKEICDQLASEILEENPKNIEALDWMAKKYYWEAENRYQQEMKAYKNNRTRSQYNQLVKALKVVTRDFKQSLNHFKTLYNLTESPKYAKFLGNIYARLDDESKAQYYHKKAE